jgi:hypothetical protein
MSKGARKVQYSTVSGETHMDSKYLDVFFAYSYLVAGKPPDQASP